MLEVNDISYDGYYAYQLRNEEISLIVLPEVGGRIVSYNVFGHEFLYTLPELKGREYNLAGIVDIKSYRRDLDYVPAGGYKTWLSPQSKWGWPPYLDLAIGDYYVEYEVGEEELKFKLTSPHCRETGMRLSRTISLRADENKVKIKQGMKNDSAETREYGLWDVTQLKGRGKIIFPLQSREDLIFLRDSELGSEVEIEEVAGELIAVVDCLGEREFKLGTSFSAGWVLTVVEKEEEKLGYLKEFPVFTDSNFGHDCAVEAFDTSDYNYFEVEVHGPVKELEMGEESSFVEEWTVYQWQAGTPLKTIISDLKV